MSKNQMDRIDKLEEIVTSLISIGGNTNQVVQNLAIKMDAITKDIHEVKKEQTLIREEILQINNKLIDMHGDQNHIWEKAPKNERELAILKNRLQL